MNLSITKCHRTSRFCLIQDYQRLKSYVVGSRFWIGHSWHIFCILLSFQCNCANEQYRRPNCNCKPLVLEATSVLALLPILPTAAAQTSKHPFKSLFLGLKNATKISPSVLKFPADNTNSTRHPPSSGPPRSTSSLTHNQCDQMARLFVQYLPTDNAANLPKSVSKLPK